MVLLSYHLTAALADTATGQCPAYSGKSKVRNDLYNCLIIIKTRFIQEHLKSKRVKVEGEKGGGHIQYKIKADEIKNEIHTYPKDANLGHLFYRNCPTSTFADTSRGCALHSPEKRKDRNDKYKG